MEEERHSMSDCDRPIFLVGASRSGTAMVRSILNNDPDVHLVGETHYFDDLRAQLGTDGRSPLEVEQRVRCETYFRAITHRPYGHGGDPEKSALDPMVLRAEAEAIGPGSDAYFEAFCRLMARVDSKARCKGVVTDMDDESKIVEIDLTLVNEANETRVLGTASVRLP